MSVQTLIIITIVVALLYVVSFTVAKSGCPKGSWRLGLIGKDGSVRYRGAIPYQTALPKWARLNSVAAVFEYDVDAQGNTKAQISEWK